MKILAFETSCDDTAVAIVENGTNVLSSLRVSQVEHEAWGGVVPEIAARLHAERWPRVLNQCLQDAGLSLEQIDFLAVTAGPGLQTSLLSGTTAASFLALFLQKKVIPVQHILGHINSVFLDRDVSEIPFPTLTLTVSGGHTDIFLCRDFTDISRLGGTMDDAAGEAFDKCAKMLGLGYPGGPIVSSWAQKGDRKKFKFPRIFLGKESLQFSFSGLKAAVFRAVEESGFDFALAEDTEKFSPEKRQFVADVCASFEQTVTDIFLRKVGRALDQFPEVKNVCFTGGVSANTFLRTNLESFLSSRRVSFFVPRKFEYCTDNAAMIAGAAFWLYSKNPNLAQVQYIDANPRLEMNSVGRV